MIVLVVDDSCVAREVLVRRLLQHPNVHAVDAAPDAYAARERIVQRRPDLLVLDLGLPGLDGESFFRKLRRHYPIPTVIFSASGSDPTTQARLRQLGVVDVVAKPERGGDTAWLEALTAAVDGLGPAPQEVASPGRAAAARSLRNAPGPRLIAVGSSTGGPDALATFLSALPASTPPVVVAQHMPSRYLAPLAQRLDRVCKMRASLADEGTVLAPGTIYVAPGDRHLKVTRHSSSLRAELDDGPKEQFQRPSVDVLLRSVAAAVGPAALGVILTGMGRDGAAGMRSLRDTGAYTIGQDESTCAVYGMPREAAQLGALVEELPLPKIAARVMSVLELAEPA